MRTLKSKKANLENKRFIFLQIGFIIALSVALLAFEWKSTDNATMNFDSRLANNSLDEIVEITKQEELKAPVPKPLAITILNIVDDTEDPDDEIEINVEDDPYTAVDVYEFKLDDEDDNKAGTDDFFIVAEDQPEFPGGYIALQRYLSNNVIYPRVAVEAHITGTVYITFIVSRNGRIRNVKLERGIGGGCDDEALRVVTSMPRWEPGRQRGKAVNVKFTLPISFKLN